MGYEKLNEKMMELKDEIFASLKESIAIESVKGAPKRTHHMEEGRKRLWITHWRWGRSLDLRLATWTISGLDRIWRR